MTRTASCSGNMGARRQVASSASSRCGCLKIEDLVHRPVPLVEESERWYSAESDKGVAGAEQQRKTRTGRPEVAG